MSETHIALNQEIFFEKIHEMIKSLNIQKNNSNDAIILARIEGWEEAIQYMSRLILSNAEPVITKQIPVEGFGFTIRND